MADVKSRESPQTGTSQTSGQHSDTQEAAKQGGALQGTAAQGVQKESRSVQQEGGGAVARRTHHPFAMMHQLSDEL